MNRSALIRFGALAPALALLAACGEVREANVPPGSDPPAAGPAARPAPAPASADPAAAPVAAGPADGAAVYGRICQTCHQADGQGLPGTYPPLARSEYVTGSADRMIRIVLHGLQGPITVNGQQYNNIMTPWKSLSDAEIAAVVSYARSNFGNSAAAVSAEDVARVRQATASRTTPYTVGELN